MARKKRRMIGLPVIIALVLIMISMVGIIAYWYINGNKLRLPGEWYRQIDMTNEIKDEISKYLDTATMGEEIDVDKYLDSVVFESHLTVTEEGTITEAIDETTYLEAKKAANAALEAMVTDLIKLRVESNYIESTMTPGELVKDTFDIELSDYLKEYGPKLMPSMDELNAEYGLNASYIADRETRRGTHARSLISRIGFPETFMMLI